MSGETENVKTARRDDDSVEISNGETETEADMSELFPVLSQLEKARVKRNRKNANKWARLADTNERRLESDTNISKVSDAGYGYEVDPLPALGNEHVLGTNANRFDGLSDKKPNLAETRAAKQKKKYEKTQRFMEKAEIDNREQYKRKVFLNWRDDVRAMKQQA